MSSSTADAAQHAVSDSSSDESPPEDIPVSERTFGDDIRRSLSLLRPERKPYALGLTALLALNICDVLAPLMLAVAVDLTVATLEGTVARTPPVLEAVGIHSAMFSIVGAVAVFLVLHALANGLRYPMLMNTAVPSHQIGQTVRRTLSGHLLRQSQSFYDRASSGDLMARATSDVNAVRMMLGPGVLVGADALSLLAMVFFVMLGMSWWLTLIVLVPLPLIGWVTNRLSRAEFSRYEAVQADISRLTERARESYAGIRIIQGYAREDFDRARFGGHSQEHCRLNLRLARVRSVFDPTLDLLFGMSTVLVLVFGGLEVVAGQLSLGTFVAFLFLVGYMAGPMIGLGWSISLVQRGRASLRRIDTLLETPVAITDPDDPVDHDGPGHLVVDRLSFAYDGPAPSDDDDREPPDEPDADAPVEVLRDISFDLPPGQTLGLIGAVGSGKSTLVRLLTRLYDPPPGTIRLDGIDVRALSLDTLRERIVTAPQDTFLFSDTVERNILLAVDDTEAAAARGVTAQRCAELARLHDELVDLADGYDTMLGERGVNLSGGQRQRLAIARAIATDPRVLVLDDCLSAVDARTEEAILANLRQIFAGRSGIIVSHRVCAVRDCDTILVLDEGRIVERGDHEALMAAQGRYATIALAQQSETGDAVTSPPVSQHTSEHPREDAPEEVL